MGKGCKYNMKTDCLKWTVKNFNCNTQIIEDYDVLRYYIDMIKKLKKKSRNKNEFADELKKEMMWHYWSRSEYELIIEITDDNQVFLKPWVGCRDAENAKINVTEDKTFDWLAFAKEHINKQILKNEAKIDIYDQLVFRWDDFIDYCWYTRLKYERDNPKFYRN